MIKKFIKKIIGEKQEWRDMEARAKKLPTDYQTGYSAIKQYIWNTGRTPAIEIFTSVLDLFEEGAANGRTLIEVTGKDVAKFCDELSDGTESYLENWRKKLNDTVAKTAKKS